MPQEQVAPRTVLVLGEALIDEFHDGPVVGGAPFNVARSLALLGAPVHFVSRIGAEDAAAALVLESAREYALPVAGLQRDDRHATGRVSVFESPGGGHEFRIHADAAWDYIEVPELEPRWTEGWLYFGSLAQRSPVSRHSLRALAKRHRGPVFLDLNLRPGEAMRELAAESLMLADWLKVNEDELAQLVAWFAPDGVAALMARFALARLLVTRGAEGYELFGAGGRLLESGAGVLQPQLRDTVGAGDAFTAMLLAGLCLCLGRPLSGTLGLANRYAAGICGLRGPLPADPAVLAPWRAALHALPAAEG
ncbi:PfkB family carbohydrate kinase [Roseateles saccharophilus]|uniref:Fructokinase n=1 Tax=Roseateles saccharophilus TaxID=304 RepID=A0A4R3VDM7_ROSSA|nr:PfkB family carbohydrate kinase [Roseateles saccharophilus]TCV02251.1 fructokinase [Roseateles saccharophilus]